MIWRLRLWGVLWCVLAPYGHASPTAPVPVSTPVVNSALSADLFYQVLMGELHVRQGDAGAGFGLLLGAAQKTHDPRLFQRATDIALKARATDAALNATRAWQQSQPQDPEPWLAALRIWVGLQRIQEASQALTQLLALSPAAEKPAILAAVPTWFAPSAQPIKTAQWVEAALQPTLALPDARPHALLALAQLAQRQGRWGAALHALQRMPTEFEPLEVAIQTAQVMAQLGQTDEAKHALLSAPTASPAQAKRKALALSQWLRDQQQAPQALPHIKAALGAAADDPELLFELSIVFEQMHMDADMERVLRQLMRQRSQDPQAYNALGYTLADRGVRLSEALGLIEQAVALAPQDPFIQDSLGWVHFRMGQHTKALDILQSAYRSRPDAEIAAHLGEVHWALGQREQALLVWQEGLRINPLQATLRATLARLGVQP